MLLRCEIRLPDDADTTTILDAIASAAHDDSKWRLITNKLVYMERTSLVGKCGSCEHYKPTERNAGTMARGTCEVKHRDVCRATPRCRKCFKEKE